MLGVKLGVYKGISMGEGALYTCKIFSMVASSQHQDVHA